MARKRPVEVVLVAKDENLEAAGQAFATASAVNLADGQIGIYSAAPGGATSMNVSVDASTVGIPGEAPKVFFAQGTAYSAAPSTAVGPSQPISVASLPIPSTGVKSVTWKEADAGVSSAWGIGNSSGQADAINVDDLTDYSFDIAFRSRIKDRNFTMSSLEVVQVHYSTPDYTALATVSPLDHLIQNLVYQTNTFSKVVTTNGRTGNKDVIALAIDINGGGGVACNAAVGTSFGTGYGGASMTQLIKDTLIEVAANSSTSFAVATSTIRPIDLSTAGAAANCDMIIVIGLDRDLAVGYDRIADVRTRIQVGLVDGFDYPTVLNEEVSKAKEAEGTARKWRLFYEDTMGQRFYGKNKTLFPFEYQYPDYINDSKTYDALVVEYEDVPFTLDSSLTTSPHKLIILIPSDASNNLKLELYSFFTNWCPQLTVPLFT